ncbi:hypothetical protein DSCA_15480 [Desulfosarcina alkanivorans]|uniref:Uncharacterized protein n=1 Tax=Desulfosarcina alkanivorans TaxID=571177 RepID=A0A5K7YEY3_9BACT|nr:hypothetical protein DSCA_15480 [Desulfosarcina alkanivorans]
MRKAPVLKGVAHIMSVYHQGNMDAFNEVIAEDGVIHINEKTAESLETAKRYVPGHSGHHR